MDAETKSPEYWIDYEVEVGSKLKNAPTLREIQEADGDRITIPFQDPGDIQPAARLISYAPYFERKYVDLEVEHIWRKQWQIACREEDIPEIGDRTTYDIVHDSYVVIRTGKKSFKAYHNSCRHRGRKLCEGKGHGEHLRCPFHGWTFGNDGKLKWIPFEQEFPHVDKKHYGLIPVQVDTWGGNVFINPDPAAPPLKQALGPLVKHFRKYPQEERYTAFRVLINLNCNWKTAQEAFLEGYHVVQTHADGMPMFGSVSSQVDCWSEGLGYVSRLCTPGMTTDWYLANDVTPRQGLELYCAAYGMEPPPEGRGHDAVDARRYAAEAQRKRIEELTGKDWSHEPVAYWIDMAIYFMFPNFHPWWGEGIPWYYNFRPAGADPERSQLEYRMLLPLPADGTRPPVPDPIVVDFGEKAESYPELGPTGHIIDQDIANMEAVQAGMKAAPKGTDVATTSRYQEMQIRRFYEIYDRLLGLDES